jgi:hypothetical protein
LTNFATNAIIALIRVPIEDNPEKCQLFWYATKIITNKKSGRRRTIKCLNGEVI